jgi:hypothetical protein
MSYIQMLLSSIGTDPRTVLLLLACTLLAVTGWILGLKFLQRGNQILGYEYLIVGSSSVNFLFYNITLYQPSYDLMIYLDAFSRAFGFPLLGSLGLMAVTHQVKVSAPGKIFLFAITLILTRVMLYSDLFAPLLPYFYLIVMYPFGLYLFYVAKRLLVINRIGTSVSLSVTSVASLAIASIYDFYKIPGEETNIVLNFFFLALVTWSAFFVALYYAYLAFVYVQEIESDPRQCVKAITRR